MRPIMAHVVRVDYVQLLSSSAAFPGPTWRASTSCRSNRRSSVIWRSCESGAVLAPRGGAGSISSRRTLKRAKLSRLGLRVSSATATGRAWARPTNLPSKGRGCEGGAGAGWRVWTCAWQPLVASAAESIVLEGFGLFGDLAGDPGAPSWSAARRHRRPEL